MPTVPVPIFDQVYRNTYGVELSQQSDRLVNGYVDEMGFIRGLPGLTRFTDLIANTNKPVSGLYWWSKKGYVISVSDGKLRKTEYISGSANTTNLHDDELTANNPTTFADDGTYVFAACDGKIIYTDGTALTSYLADAQAPTAVSHVAYLDGYLLANVIGTNTFMWSDVGDSLSWAALSIASAEFDADDINALHVFNRQIFLFGERSLEVWQNDGANPFSRIPGGAHSTGCIAPGTVVENRGVVYWLDNRRHFVAYNNGVITPMPGAFDLDIAKFPTVSDAQGVRMELNGRTFLAFTFPSADKSYLYDLATGKWSEAGEWNSTTMKFERSKVNAYCHAEGWGKHLFGDKDSSLVYEQDLDAFTNNGDEIRMFHRTGHVDYGTLNLKRNRELRIQVKRGQSGTSATPKLMIRWQDNNSGHWSKERTYSLGDQGDTYSTIRLRATGIYRTRQYEITVSDPVAIAFGRAEEDIEVLQ